MNVTYVVHDRAGVKGATDPIVATGELAKLVLSYLHKQGEAGITILEIDDEAVQSIQSTVVEVDGQ